MTALKRPKNISFDNIKHSEKIFTLSPTFIRQSLALSSSEPSLRESSRNVRLQWLGNINFRFSFHSLERLIAVVDLTSTDKLSPQRVSHKKVIQTISPKAARQLRDHNSFLCEFFCSMAGETFLPARVSLAVLLILSRTVGEKNSLSAEEESIFSCGRFLCVAVVH